MNGGGSLVVAVSMLGPILKKFPGLVFWVKDMEFRYVGVLVVDQGSLVLVL